ncbi:hypothetical protein PHMEG_00012424 [Phytophthora megakarya]|uniref:Uncharacterized protein n=1 Tax=Phytophthora megakarya TaxID=4795 RepID=A0A225WAV3_9STRA|nr:hypothetical protein PHMEG_00012424 [Phytophthora megakarya]
MPTHWSLWSKTTTICSWSVVICEVASTSWSSRWTITLLLRGPFVEFVEHKYSVVLNQRNRAQADLGEALDELEDRRDDSAELLDVQSRLLTTLSNHIEELEHLHREIDGLESRVALHSAENTIRPHEAHLKKLEDSEAHLQRHASKLESRLGHAHARLKRACEERDRFSDAAAVTEAATRRFTSQLDEITTARDKAIAASQTFELWAASLHGDVVRLEQDADATRKVEDVSRENGALSLRVLEAETACHVAEEERDLASADLFALRSQVAGLISLVQPTPVALPTADVPAADPSSVSDRPEDGASRKRRSAQDPDEVTPPPRSKPRHGSPRSNNPSSELDLSGAQDDVSVGADSPGRHGASTLRGLRPSGRDGIGLSPSGPSLSRLRRGDARSDSADHLRDADSGSDDSVIHALLGRRTSSSPPVSSDLAGTACDRLIELDVDDTDADNAGAGRASTPIRGGNVRDPVAVDASSAPKLVSRNELLTPAAYARSLATVGQPVLNDSDWDAALLDEGNVSAVYHGFHAMGGSREASDSFLKIVLLSIVAGHCDFDILLDPVFLHFPRPGERSKWYPGLHCTPRPANLFQVFVTLTAKIPGATSIATLLKIIPVPSFPVWRLRIFSCR